MTGLEIIYLVAALVAVSGFLFAVRRASAKSAQLGEAARKRLPGPAQEEADEEEEEREGEDEEEQEEEEDEEAARERDGEEEEDAGEPARAAEEAALRDGLARTRGGFVARL